MSPMTALVKKVHMYLGLLNYTILTVFGLAGLWATLQPAPDKRERPVPVVRFENFQTPGNADDRQVAALVYETVKPPLAPPLPDYALRRDPAGNLRLNYYAMNGPTTVTVLEKEGRLRIESTRNDVWRFIDNLHTTTVNSRASDLRVRMWTWYNEFAIWSLIAMGLSGVWLWLASRPGWSAAQIVFLAGNGAFALLYVLTR